EGISRLCSCELDEIMGECSEALDLSNEFFGKVANLHRVFSRRMHGFTKETNRPYRGLELMGDVPQKVSAYAVKAFSLAVIIGEDEQLTIAQQGDTHGELKLRSPKRAASQP